MPLILAFETEQLRDICRSEVVAFRQLPSSVARGLFRRIADIRAASCVLNLPVGNPTQIYEKPPGKVSIHVSDDFYLMFSAAHQKIPLDEFGNVAWEEVSRIKLLSIGGLND